MSAWRLNAPVALILFNRPDTTQKVFDEIAKVRPSKLLFVSDGPRTDRVGEAEQCEKARRVIEGVNWDCDVLRNYSDVNLGCKKRVSSGLDWVFDCVDEAIILEDDCIPDVSFFQFCEELLERYRDDTRIAQISGANFQFGRRRAHYSYYFSRYTHLWGWASWRRAWRNYDVNMKLWPEIRDGQWLYDWLDDSRSARYWARIFEKTYQGEIDTWCYQWTLSSWINSALSILPNVNLISNIGFGRLATHTRWQNEFANMRMEGMEFPLIHPPHFIRDSVADSITEKKMFSRKPIVRRIASRLIQILANRKLSIG